MKNVKFIEAEIQSYKTFYQTGITDPAARAEFKKLHDALMVARVYEAQRGMVRPEV